MRLTLQLRRAVSWPGSVTKNITKTNDLGTVLIVVLSVETPLSVRQKYFDQTVQALPFQPEL